VRFVEEICLCRHELRLGADHSGIRFMNRRMRKRRSDTQAHQALATSEGLMKSIHYIARPASYLLGAFASAKLCAAYWYVGPIFGAVVLVWCFGLSARPQLFRLFSFFLCSTLLYALVFLIANIRQPGWMFEPFDMVAVGVSVGSILLPMSHVLLFGGRWSSSAITSMLLILSYFAVYCLFIFLQKIGLPGSYSTYILVYVWQGVYLVRFFPLKV